MLATKKQNKTENFQVGKIGWSYVKVKRQSGYRYYSALADLVDNSLDANAEKISVKLIHSGVKTNGLTEIHLVDNGFGMDYETLQGSFSLGYVRERTTNQLGKFGVGGTEGPLSFAAEKITLTRLEGSSQILCREYDLRKVRELDAWGSISRKPTEEEVRLFNRELGDSSGTYIIMRNLDLITNRDVTKVKNVIIKHFSELFCEYIFSGVQIIVDNRKVDPVDPLLWAEKGTVQMYGPKSIDGFPGITLKVADVLATEGHKPSYRKQGGYIYRCNRLIVGSLTDGDKISGFWENDPHMRGVRWQLNFNADYDEDMGTTTRKDDVNIRQSLLDKIREIVMPFAKEARKREAKLSKKSPTQKEKLVKDITTVVNDPLITRKLTKKIKNEKIVDDKVIPLSSGKNTREKFANIEIIEADQTPHGPIGNASVNPEGEGYCIKINKENAYIQKYYVNAESPETQEAVLSFCVAQLITELEFNDTGEIFDFLSNFNNKLNVFSRKL